MTERKAWLAGTNFYDMGCFRASREFPKDMPLLLQRAHGNEHDPNAVAVFVDAGTLHKEGVRPSLLTKSHFKLGYVPAKDGTAAWLAPLMDAGKKVTATHERHSASGQTIQINITVEDAP